MRTCACGLALAMALAAAHAQSAGGDVSACTVVADDAARLACYDRAAGRSVPPTPTEAPAAAVAAVAAASSPASGLRIVTATAPSASMFDDRWDLRGGQPGELFVPRPYRPVYLLPATWTDRVNVVPNSPTPEHTSPEALNLRPLEAKYQLSFKAKLWERVAGTPMTLWGGYTQSSRWQVYNGAISRPFRETNYEPELMLVWPLEWQALGWGVRSLGLSLNHQSNGRALPLSRSWNRVIGEVGLERGAWTLQLRPWWRIRESPETDDNPDIEDHVGRAELLVTHEWQRHVAALQLRHSLRGGSRSRGSAQFEWAFPIDGALRGYLQWFSGYGESLVDYNFRQNRLGLGISIVGWR